MREQTKQIIERVETLSKDLKAGKEASAELRKAVKELNKAIDKASYFSILPFCKKYRLELKALEDCFDLLLQRLAPSIFKEGKK